MLSTVTAYTLYYENCFLPVLRSTHSWDGEGQRVPYLCITLVWPNVESTLQNGNYVVINLGNIRRWCYALPSTYVKDAVGRLAHPCS